jgi:HK97 gp10 family phage protein
MGSAFFKIDGGKELSRKLFLLGDRAKSALTGAVRAAAKPIVDDAKARCPVRFGALRESIGLAVRFYSRSGTAVAVIGPRVEYKASGKGGKMFAVKGKVIPANYAHLVEYGTRPHAIGKGSQLERTTASTKGRQTGLMHPGAKAQPFLRPAFDSNKQNAERIIQDELTKAVEAAFARG